MSFPRGKEPGSEADSKQKQQQQKQQQNGGAAGGGGGPAAKRKREAKAAATPPATAAAADTGSDFLFGGLPKKKPKQQARGDGDAEGAAGSGKMDEATKLAQVCKARVDFDGVWRRFLFDGVWYGWLVG
jgi:hypothetical protein